MVERQFRFNSGAGEFKIDMEIFQFFEIDGFGWQRVFAGTLFFSFALLSSLSGFTRSGAGGDPKNRSKIIQIDFF